MRFIETNEAKYLDIKKPLERGALHSNKVKKLEPDERSCNRTHTWRP